MSSALVSQFYDVGDVIRQNAQRNQLKQHQTVERRNTIGAPLNVTRNRNFTIGNFNAVPGNTPHSCVISMDNQIFQAGLTKDHRKLDRSNSEPCDTRTTTLNNNTNLNLSQQQQQQQQQQKQTAVNSSRYKTELCRPFEESGHCKYADKCQFAHGQHELKTLSRHPKYKTELCRTFHSKGFCPYGPRCNFVHNEELRKLNEKNNHMTAQQQQQQQQQQQVPVVPPPTQYFHHISPPALSQSPPLMAQRPTSINFNTSFSGSVGSASDSSPPSSVGSESPSLSPVFFGDETTLNSCYSLPGNNVHQNVDNSSSNSVFNIAELAAMDLSPLNIQTQMNNTDLAVVTQQFNAILNLNNHNQTNNVKCLLSTPSVDSDTWDPPMFGAPLTSPDSISGDSVGSSGSFSGSMDGSKFRLPVFNHISQE